MMAFVSKLLHVLIVMGLFSGTQWQLVLKVTVRIPVAVADALPLKQKCLQTRLLSLEFN